MTASRLALAILIAILIALPAILPPYFLHLVI
jgi:hypothetical protein